MPGGCGEVAAGRCRRYTCTPFVCRVPRKCTGKSYLRTSNTRSSSQAAGNLSLFRPVHYRTSFLVPSFLSNTKFYATHCFQRVIVTLCPPHCCMYFSLVYTNYCFQSLQPPLTLLVPFSSTLFIPLPSLAVLLIRRDYLPPYQMLSLETFFFHLYALPECGWRCGGGMTNSFPVSKDLTHKVLFYCNFVIVLTGLCHSK